MVNVDKVSKYIDAHLNQHMRAQRNLMMLSQRKNLSI